MWGTKEKSEIMERRKKEQQGHIWRKIHSKKLEMRAVDGRIEGEHYLREWAAPGGRAVALGSVRVRWVAGRCCWGANFFSDV